MTRLAIHQGIVAESHHTKRRGAILLQLYVSLVVLINLIIIEDRLHDQVAAIILSQVVPANLLGVKRILAIQVSLHRVRLDHHLINLVRRLIEASWVTTVLLLRLLSEVR